VKKGKDINDYREKHGIRVKGQEPPAGAAASSAAASSSVLVANKA